MCESESESESEREREGERENQILLEDVKNFQVNEEKDKGNGNAIFTQQTWVHYDVTMS